MLMAQETLETSVEIALCEQPGQCARTSVKTGRPSIYVVSFGVDTMDVMKEIDLSLKMLPLEISVAESQDLEQAVAYVTKHDHPYLLVCSNKILPHPELAPDGNGETFARKFPAAIKIILHYSNSSGFGNARLPHVRHLLPDFAGKIIHIPRDLATAPSIAASRDRMDYVLKSLFLNKTRKRSMPFTTYLSLVAETHNPVTGEPYARSGYSIN